MPTSPEQQADIANRKQRFIEYYEKVPVVKYAAQYAGRDEDTAHRWLKEDTDFAYQVQEAEARFIREKMKHVKGEFALERLFKQVFAQRTELTGKDGGPIESEEKHSRVSLIAEIKELWPTLTQEERDEITR